jgi:DNA primase
MLSTTTIDAVRDVAIEEVIARYITLKKTSNHSFNACCPFHNENTPSFVVSVTKNIFHCFGCGESGDAIKFVMLHEKLDFIAACKAIATDSGIAIEETEVKGKTVEQIAEEEIYFAQLQDAESVFQKLLKDNSAISNYLRSDRKLSTSTIIEWNLGICPDWRVLAPELISSGKYAIAEKFGLLRTGNGNTYDFYHHRLTIPIHNAQGRLIGFGGRILPGTDGAKYINPVDSSVYPKSKILFGLHKARKHFLRHGGACLVEGYFDVIKLHQRGWNNAVATCGTALTEEHAKALRRFTDTVYIMRDGDKAGLNAILKDIPILVAQQFKIYVILLPAGEDPDSLFDDHIRAAKVLERYQDGIEYLTDLYINEGKNSGATGMAEAIDKVVALIADINNMVMREQYMKVICAKHKLKISDLSKPLDRLYTQRREAAEAAAGEEDPDSILPGWIDRKSLEENGFVQLAAPTKGWKQGIYFYGDNKSLYRTTNFTIKPLYHIFEQSNNRRLIEVNNNVKTAIVEMPSNALVNQNAFESELVSKGHFVTEFTFTKKQFKTVSNWLSGSMDIAYELKTLGWQPEGFFAYSNMVFVPDSGTLLEYDDMGMVQVADKHYMSLGNSKIHKDERLTDNPYENDLYLKFTKSPITFGAWAKEFNETYNYNAPYGIAFAFLTMFKDIVVRVAKMPMLYCYGPKGSGKSAMAESLTYLFFSGKNGEGEFIKGYNLNPGQGTPFSFFNRVERFRNCPILFNEFDENNIEDWKFGTMKAAYDGEGREVGDGDSFKKRKTKIQKVQGTIILVGQYMSIKDDGSVLSRSLSCQFSLERVTNVTQQQRDAYNRLKEFELQGLSSILIEMLQHRPHVQKVLAKHFSDIQIQLSEETRKLGHRVEARLISNYCLVLAATKVMEELGIELPYTFDSFYEKCKSQVIAHNQILKDNSAIHQFWKAVEIMFDKGFVQTGTDFVIRAENRITLKDDGKTFVKDFPYPKQLLIIKFSKVYSTYEKFEGERKKRTLPEDTVLLYMKEQPYYVGLCPFVSFTDKRTSAHVFDYDMMQDLGIVLEKYNHGNSDSNGAATPMPEPPAPTPTPVQQEIPEFLKPNYSFDKK